MFVCFGTNNIYRAAAQLSSTTALKGLQERVSSLFHPFRSAGPALKGLVFRAEKSEADLAIDSYIRSANYQDQFDQAKGALLKVFPDAKPWQIPQFFTIFQNISDEQLNTFLKEIFLQEGTKPIAPLLSQLSKVLTLQKIEAAIRTEFTQFISTENLVDGLVQLSGKDLELRKLQSRNTLFRITATYLINGLDQFVDVMLYVFNLKDSSFGTAQDNSFRAQMRYYSLQSNLALLGTWFMGLTAIVGDPVSAFIITALLGSTAAALIFSYLNWFKLAPDEFLGYTNLVTEVIKGNVPPVQGREKEVQEIIDQLLANESVRVHPLLLGKTGVGKTAIVDALAWRLAEGVPGLPTKLFVIPAMDFNNEDRMELIRQSIEGFHGKVIFFIDEIHAPFMKSEETGAKPFNQNGQKFKTLLNPGPRNFKYCIGATTQIEYEKYMKDETGTIERRFHPVTVESISDDQTFAVLSDMVQREGKGLLVEQEALKTLAELKKRDDFREVAQPFTSKSILGLAISRARSPRLEELENQLAKLFEQKRVLTSEFALSRAHERSLYEEKGAIRSKAIQGTSAKIFEKENEIASEKKSLQAFSELLEKRHSLRTDEPWAALCLQDSLKANRSTDLVSFILSHHYLGRAFDALIEKKKGEHPNAYTVGTQEIEQALHEKSSPPQAEQI